MALDFAWALGDLELSKPILNSDGSVTFLGITQTTYKFIMMFSKLEAELYMPHKSTVMLRVKNRETAKYLLMYKQKKAKALEKNSVQGLPLEWSFLEYDSRSHARVCLDKKEDIWKAIDIQGFIVSSFWENPHWPPKNKMFVLYDTDGEMYTSSQLLTRHEYEKFDNFCTIQTFGKQWPNFPYKPVDRKSHLQFARIASLK